MAIIVAIAADPTPRCASPSGARPGPFRPLSALLWWFFASGCRACISRCTARTVKKPDHRRDGDPRTVPNTRMGRRPSAKRPRHRPAPVAHGLGHAAPPASIRWLSARAYEINMAKMHGPMQVGIQHPDPDVAFVLGMIPHHQGAIDMAQIQLPYGKDPANRKLAREIIAAQQHEIEEMKSWLAAKASSTPSRGNNPSGLAVRRAPCAIPDNFDPTARDFAVVGFHLGGM